MGLSSERERETDVERFRARDSAKMSHVNLSRYLNSVTRWLYYFSILGHVQQ